MNPANLIRLLALAAIWDGSFIFIRVLAPILGPLATADFRVLIAGIALLAYFKASRFDPRWRRFWKQYLIIGAVNSAAPFSLYSYAAIHMPASLEVILNSSAPLFGAVFSAIWLGERLSMERTLGLLAGATGVGLVAGLSSTPDPRFGFAVAACLCAAACYGLAAVYMKRFAAMVPSKAIAGCSQFAAGILLLPGVLAMPPTVLNGKIIANVLGLALVCSAIAYLLYFRLIAEIGATRALTVTFLMPIFGMLWGRLFLGETITLAMLGGCGLILVGTGLVVGILKIPRLQSREECTNYNI